MLIYDNHIHIMDGETDPAGLLRRMREAGVTGGNIISRPPEMFSAVATPTPAAARLDELFAWTSASPEFFPFYWIDPLEPDALAQVAQATERGVAGYKVICSTFDPGDPRALPVYHAIARTGKPLLFHSGILWDGRPSSLHCRPVNFEPLLEVDGLKFALAHISWPWCDECIAVFGKFLDAYQRPPGAVGGNVHRPCPPALRRSIAARR